MSADGSAPKKTGASLNRSGSNPNRGTPREFLEAVEARFGPLEWDLAADAKNCVVLNGDDEPSGQFFSKKENSLAQDWRVLGGLLWLNPPFDNVAPWAKKCAEEANARTRIIFLTQASIGANWYWKWVRPYAVSYILHPRLVFVGETNHFPKDLMISLYGFGVTALGRWRWKGASE